MEEKLGTTGRRDGGLCDGRETWYNWNERWWTVRWTRNLVQQEGEMVDSAMEEKLATTGMRDGGLCDGRETWYNWNERWWTVRWKRNLVQLE